MSGQLQWHILDTQKNVHTVDTYLHSCTHKCIHSYTHAHLYTHIHTPLQVKIIWVHKRPLWRNGSTME